MARVKNDGISQQPASRPMDGALPLGVLLVLTALVMNKWSLERIFSPDEYISSGLSIALIAVFELCLFLAGLWLLLKRPALTTPVLLRRAVAIGLAGGVLMLKGRESDEWRLLSRQKPG